MHRQRFAEWGLFATTLLAFLSACEDDRSIGGYDPYGPGGEFYDAGTADTTGDGGSTNADSGVGPQMAGPRAMYTNPVVPVDCPDPGVLRVDSNPIQFYMVCTGGRFPLRKSDDMTAWSDAKVALLPFGVAPWANNGNRNWAPELHGKDGQFLAYYTASNKSDKLSIGAQSAPAITGPWKDLGRTLLVDDQNIGVIDANYFEDSDGKKYLFWKRDSNQNPGQKVSIYAQQLADDGLGFAPGTTRTLIANNNPASWEEGVIEATWLYKRGGYYYLFYSGNVYDYRYRTGVARATSILGPYIKKSDPILNNSSKWVGPGHGSVISTRSGEYFIYHAWRNNGAGRQDESKGRNVLLDKIDWVDDWPSINGGKPSDTPKMGP